MLEIILKYLVVFILGLVVGICLTYRVVLYYCLKSDIDENYHFNHNSKNR